MKTMKKITFLLLILVSSLTFSQTGVSVTYYDGSTQGFNVTTTGKLYFASDNLYVKIDETTTPTTIPVTIIRKITFSEALSVSTFGYNKNNLTLFPNPSSDIIRIKSDVIEDLNTKIYSLTGQLVQEGVYKQDSDIDISALASGLYLVQINGLTIKFSKK